MTNKHHTVLYTGVTRNIDRRFMEHLSAINPNSFTARYNIQKLVYVEEYQLLRDAIAREKQLKGASRLKKIQLIESMNPDWQDLFGD